MTLLLLGRSGAAEGMTPSPQIQPPEPHQPALTGVLNLPALAQQTPLVELDPEHLTTALIRNEPEQVEWSGAVRRTEQQAVVAYGACDQQTCWGEVALLDLTRQVPCALRRVPLPLPAKRVWAVTGLRFEPPALHDLTGDGRAELLTDLLRRRAAPPCARLGPGAAVSCLHAGSPGAGLATRTPPRRRVRGRALHLAGRVVCLPVEPRPRPPPELRVTGQCEQDRCLDDGRDPPNCRRHRERKERWHRHAASGRFTKPR